MKCHRGSLRLAVVVMLGTLTGFVAAAGGAEETNPSPSAPIPNHQPLAIRGLREPLPLWLGTLVDGGWWRRHESAEQDAAGPWFDRDLWQSRLKDLSRNGFNALVLEHPNPFPGLIRLKDHPEAAWFEPDDQARHHDQFRWLLAGAKKRRIAVYLLTCNLDLPTRMGEAHGLDKKGLNASSHRAYLRESFSTLFREYPDLTGLVVSARIYNQGSPEPSPDAIAEPIRELRQSTEARLEEAFGWPRFILLSDCESETSALLDTFPDAWFMAELQDGRWLMPQVDACVRDFMERAHRTETSADSTRTVLLGGPRSAYRYLLWFDGEWLRDLSIDLRRHATAGFIFDADCAESWLAEEALGLYSLHAGPRYSPQPWRERLAEVYGTGDGSAQLLDTIEHASAIIPLLTRLLPGDRDRFMPQFGLPLTHYLEVPSDSQDLFEDIGSDAVTPERIAEGISHHVISCKSILPRLRELEPESKAQRSRFRTLLWRIDMNVALGEHFSHKIKAAIAWRRYKANQGDVVEIIRPLELSVRAWQRVADAAENIYPEPVSYWQSQMVSPRPWTPEQFADGYRLMEGHWRDRQRVLRRELDLVRQATSLLGRDAELPLWDVLNALPGEDLDLIYRLDFESEEINRLIGHLHEGGAITGQSDHAIAGSRALLGDTRSLPPGPHTVFTSNPETMPLFPDRPYQISFTYRVVEAPDDRRDVFEVGVRRTEGTAPVGDHRRWYAPAGHLGSRVIQVPMFFEQGCQLYVTLHAPASIVIDKIEIHSPKAF